MSLKEFQTLLKELKLSAYEQQFIDDGYEEVATFNMIVPEEVKEFGFMKPGHKKKLLLYLSNKDIIKDTEESPTEEYDDENVGYISESDEENPTKVSQKRKTSPDMSQPLKPQKIPKTEENVTIDDSTNEFNSPPEMPEENQAENIIDVEEKMENLEKALDEILKTSKTKKFEASFSNLLNSWKFEMSKLKQNNDKTNLETQPTNEELRRIIVEQIRTFLDCKAFDVTTALKIDPTEILKYARDTHDEFVANYFGNLKKKMTICSERCTFTIDIWGYHHLRTLKAVLSRGGEYDDMDCDRQLIADFREEFEKNISEYFSLRQDTGVRKYIQQLVDRLSTFPLIEDLGPTGVTELNQIRKTLLEACELRKRLLLPSVCRVFSTFTSPIYLQAAKLLDGESDQKYRLIKFLKQRLSIKVKYDETVKFALTELKDIVNPICGALDNFIEKVNCLHSSKGKEQYFENKFDSELKFLNEVLNIDNEVQITFAASLENYHKSLKEHEMLRKNRQIGRNTVKTLSSSETI